MGLRVITPRPDSTLYGGFSSKDCAVSVRPLFWLVWHPLPRAHCLDRSVVRKARGDNSHIPQAKHTHTHARTPLHSQAATARAYTHSHTLTRARGVSWRQKHQRGKQFVRMRSSIMFVYKWGEMCVSLLIRYWTALNDLKIIYHCCKSDFGTQKMLCRMTASVKKKKYSALFSLFVVHWKKSHTVE